MTRVSRMMTLAVVGLTLAALMFLLPGAWAQGSSPLMISDGVHSAHIFPTVQRKAEIPTDNGPLLYHTGGLVMTGPLKFYAIYWIPAHLQTGGSTTLPSHYQTVQTNLLAYYIAHGISNNNTQYYQTISGATAYVSNQGLFGGAYVDTNPYPASGCNDADTPGNCITDAQIQAEIQRVLTLKGWTGGIGKMFLLFTSSGEGSCFDSTSSSCAYTDYCAYHSYISGGTPIIYGNQPYGDANFCQVPGTPSHAVRVANRP